MIVCYQYNHIQNIRKQTFIFTQYKYAIFIFIYKEKKDKYN